MANDMNKFLEINEGRAMIMAKKIDDQGNEYVTDNTLALGGYQFIQRKGDDTYVLFDIDPINLQINRVAVNKLILNSNIIDLLG
jgi:hypothetical protein